MVLSPDVVSLAEAAGPARPDPSSRPAWTGPSPILTPSQRLRAARGGPAGSVYGPGPSPGPGPVPVPVPPAPGPLLLKPPGALLAARGALQARPMRPRGLQAIQAALAPLQRGPRGGTISAGRFSAAILLASPCVKPHHLGAERARPLVCGPLACGPRRFAAVPATARDRLPAGLVRIGVTARLQALSDCRPGAAGSPGRGSVCGPEPKSGPEPKRVRVRGREQQQKRTRELTRRPGRRSKRRLRRDDQTRKRGERSGLLTSARQRSADPVAWSSAHGRRLLQAHVKKPDVGPGLSGAQTCPSQEAAKPAGLGPFPIDRSSPNMV